MDNPDNTPLEKANSEIGYIVGWCVLACVVTTICAFGGWLGLDRWSLLDSVLFGIGAWRINKYQSRTWAVIVLLDVLLGVALRFSKNPTAAGASLIPLYFVIRGLIGVFKFHKIKASTPVILPTAA
jgi:hypothetical protein